MSPVIDIEYEGKVKRFPFPTTKISEFIGDLRKEYSIPSNTTLKLLEGEVELTQSSTLEQVGVENKAKLTLIKVNDTVSIRVQTIKGEVYSLPLTSEATVKNLFDSIQKEIKFTTTYPLLFNHRMHLFVTPKFLDEPLMQLFNLTTIHENNVPHFYLFECERKFEPHAYDYSKNSKDIFIMNELWQPKSCQQSNEAMEVYLNVMYALVRVFLTEKNVDFDSLHSLYMPQFLIVLRRHLFPPACLAFKHALEGALFNFEKSLLSEAFYHFLRRLLPTSIVDAELFTYTPQVFCWLFEHRDYASHESACYELAEFINRSKLLDGAQAEGQNASYVKYLTKPVRVLNNTVVNSASERFVLMEYDEIQLKPEISSNDYQIQTDLIGLLMYIEKFGQKNETAGAVPNNVFETFSSDYTLWAPIAAVELSPISDVNEQISNTKRLLQTELNELKQQLGTNDLCSIFTFADPSKLSKHNHAQLILLKSGHIVYIVEAEKAIDDSYTCFDPCGEESTFEKSNVATTDVLSSKAFAVIRENAADIRKIEQITCILFDISGSMKTMVGEQNNKHSLLELSTIAFSAWRDRLSSYKLPHAIGLIYFGAEDGRSKPFAVGNFFSLLTQPSQRERKEQIVVQCDITRDFAEFEAALSDRPDCGNYTPMFDAINCGIQKIRSFREKAGTKLSSTCKDLILCLTDGDENNSVATKASTLEELLKNKIVFDVVSFADKASNVLLEFCEKTKGYYYTNISHDKESMLNLFELEAAISIQDRDETIFGKITQPQRRKPQPVDKPAVAAKQAKLGDGRASSIGLRRIMQEINHLNKSNMTNFELYVAKENMFFWKLIMHGETGTPYADGRWLLSVEFPENFPLQPPDIRFITKIYHCNVNDDGKICHDVLTSAWSQKTSMHNVFMELLRLLREPNAGDALSSAKGAQFKESQDNYKNNVVEWKKQYASASVEELKKMYALE